MKLISAVISHPRKASRWFALVAFLCVASLAAHAQFRTSVQGVVTDPQGEVIPGATLTLNDTATNKTLVQKSNDAGIFNFNALPASNFTLTVERQGFAKKVLTDLQFVPEQANALNVQLAVGDVSTTVNVNASQAPVLNTETAATGQTITASQLEHMPSSNRDIFTLSQLAPGAINDGSQASGGGVYNAPGNQGPGGSSNIGARPTENGPQTNANGGQYGSNGINIDGISTVSAVWGGTTIITPDPDSIANVQIVTNQYDAENGRFSGALTQVTTKSGTNQVHGSLYISIHRPGLNAYQPSFTVLGNPFTPQRNTERFNQYGGSVGGPLWKNRVFAFFDYENIPNSSTVTTTGWYDTAAFDALGRSGSIANTYLTFPGAAALGTIIPTNCAGAGLTEGVNCHSVTGGLNIGSPLTSPLGTHDPTAGGSATNAGLGSGLSDVPDIAEYNSSTPSSSYYHAYNGRLDADATKNDHLSFTIYWIPQGSTSYNGIARPYNLFHSNQVNDAFTVIWNHVISPTFLNEARANAAGYRWNQVADNPQAPVGLPDDTLTSYNNLGIQANIGSINLNRFGPTVGSTLNQWTYSYKDVATKVWGQQTIKFGGEFTRLQYLNDPTYIDVPSYQFYNIWDFLNDAPMEETGSFQPLTGLPGQARQDDRENLFGFFVQDDWKVRPNLTINLGLRYSYFGSLFTKQNNVGVVLLGSGTSTYTGISIRTGGNLWTPQKGNFGPQIGFAWSPENFHNKLVVRGGYGLSYNQEEIAISANGGSNPPATYNLSNSFSYVSPGNPGPNGGKIVYALSSSPTNFYGYPPNPNTIVSFNAAGLPSASGFSITAFPSHLPTAYSQHYSLDLQYDLGYSLVATAGYEGSVSRHLIGQENLNAAAQINGQALNPLVANLDYYGNENSSNNNALLLGLKHQFAHQFSAEGQFMWAKSMDNGSGPYEEDTYFPLGPIYSYGRSDYNVGKSFKAFGTWQPIFFRGSHSWLEKVAGGWNLSGIYTVHTGFGWTPSYSAAQSMYCATCNYTNLRPNYSGGGGHKTSNKAFETQSNFPNYGTVTAAATVTQAAVNNPTCVAGSGNYPGCLTTVQYSNQYFSTPNLQSAMTWANPAGFPAVNVAPPPAPGFARNSFNGPGYRDVDASLSKTFGLPRMPVLGSSAGFEIGVNALNLFNNLNLNTQNIVTDVTSPNFGTINQSSSTSVLGSRAVTFNARFSF
jgi:hypothetical protein